MLNLINISAQFGESWMTPVINDISLAIDPGFVYYIQGRNGVGKSTLLNMIMGRPDIVISSGKMVLEDDFSQTILAKVPANLITKLSNDQVQIDITHTPANTRSLLGIFLANQHPVEVPGVSLMTYLRLIYNNRLPREEQLSVFKFKQKIQTLAESFNYPPELLTRNLNEGFSGGEKKKTEILQLLLLQPQIVLLDEIDSGLDKQSTKEVFQILKLYKHQNPKVSFVIVTHYDLIRDYLPADYTFELKDCTLREIS